MDEWEEDPEVTAADETPEVAEVLFSFPPLKPVIHTSELESHRIPEIVSSPPKLSAIGSTLSLRWVKW